MKQVLIKSLIITCCFFASTGCLENKLENVVTNNTDILSNEVESQKVQSMFKAGLSLTQKRIRTNQEVKLEMTLVNTSDNHHKIGTGDKIFRVYLMDESTQKVENILPLTSEDTIRFHTLSSKDLLKEVVTYKFANQGTYRIWAVAEIHELVEKNYKVTEYKTDMLQVTVE
ncbi:hypothetical protein [Paenibacillus sp. N3.4]|uniref:hypothetical protein n=1 Tax=Paenibacillus sp. N3.4 TaxID=2603222 RepID=UPI0011CC8431|nr:hypothetical protein [Paenibacillus sp. N3.4]TXK85557.1 hypothetical protein FU659_03110 [Paenibacillus sp. N3.4]